MRYALLVLIFLIPVAAQALAGQAALVNINTADATLLDTLPGIGPSKAAAIIDYRTKNGPFAVIEDIQNVSGIGPTTFANMKAQITVGTVSPTAAEQPSADAVSYEKKAVEPITSTTNIQTHEEAVRAPAVATELAPAGAALPPPVANSRSSGIFNSIWTLGLLAVIVVAGGVFIFL